MLIECTDCWNLEQIVHYIYTVIFVDWLIYMIKLALLWLLQKWGSSWSSQRIWFWGWWKIRKKGIGNLGSTCMHCKTVARKPRKCGAYPWGHMGFGPLSVTTLSLLGMLKSPMSLVVATRMMRSLRRFLNNLQVLDSSIVFFYVIDVQFLIWH